MKRVICVGNGLSAIFFSLLLDPSIELNWVMEEESTQSNSYLAKGGIAVSLSEEDQQHHVEDTLLAGAGLCVPEIVHEVIENSPLILQALKSRGLVFDPDPGREGGHSHARIQHIEDQTGKFILSHLVQTAIKRENTRFYRGHVLLELSMENGRCKGVELANSSNGECIIITADAVVLATGGSGNLFKISSNGICANGEGLAIAKRAGARLSDLEFIQFHPTRLYSQNPAINVLITEAFRGAGAYLCGQTGETFMDKLHPMASLAPRDIVSLGIQQWMLANNQDFVYLNFETIDIEKFKKDFPYLYQVALENGFLESKKIPVTPAAHYHCGGIVTDNIGQTSVEGLFAIGEVARTGLHGANRLASNSLLELFHFSIKLSKHLFELPSESAEQINGIGSLSVQTDPRLVELEIHMKNLMWDSFGIIRKSSGMQSGIDTLQQWKQELINHPKNTIQYKRLLNRIETCLLIGEAAIARQESIGCHFVKQE